MSNLDFEYVGWDIDWYAVDLNGALLHFDSGGGRVPKGLNDEMIKKWATLVKELPDLTDNRVLINPDINKFRTFATEAERNRYLEIFVAMARKGIFSFGRVSESLDDDPNYFLMAAPSVCVKGNVFGESADGLISVKKYIDFYDDRTVDIADIDV